MVLSRIGRTVSSNPENTLEGPSGVGRYGPLLVLAAAIFVAPLLPLKIIGYGYLPPDDAVGALWLGRLPVKHGPAGK